MRLVTLLLAGLGIVMVLVVGPIIIDPGPQFATEAPVSAVPTVAPTPVALPAAVMTPTGVPLPVVGPVPTGLLVETPCGGFAQLRQWQDLGQIDVVLDPGHGGPVDTGAVGPNGLVERDINLTLAAATQQLLLDRGISALLTRTSDYAMSLPVRARLADAVGAKALLSIHHNAPVANASTVPGTEIYVQTGSSDASRFGGLVQEAVVAGLSRFIDVDWDRAQDAGVLEVINQEGADAYGIVRRPAAPSALIEMGYLANAAEARVFAHPLYLEIAPVALADGIEAYLTTDRAGSGFGNPPRVRNPAASAATRDCTNPPLQ